ncbi:MAG: SMP-30/gluconolactonase/LRE family protein [Melioribacteraceae bacterium]
MKLIIPFLILFTFLFTVGNPENIEFSEWELVVANHQFPEGITYNHNGILYSSNCNGNWITRISETKIDTFLLASDSTFQKTNGMLALPDGSILAADFGKGAILKIYKNGKTEILLDGYNKKRFNKPNDLTLDKNGNLFFSEPNTWDQKFMMEEFFIIIFLQKL